MQTKDKYLLNMTRSLYYQKLDTGTGVIMRLSTAAVRQEAAEAILILYALATADRPLSHRMLRRRCERLLRELLDVEVLARLEPGMSWLATLELIAVDPDGRVRCTLPGATPTLAPRGAGQGGALDA